MRLHFCTRTRGCIFADVRSEYGIAEDPATGSATGPLAAYMMRHGLTRANRFISEQGVKMGRRSYCTCNPPNGAIDVGGYVTPLVEATMTL